MKIINAKIDSYIANIANEKIAGCLVFGPETSVVNYRFSLIAKKIVADISDPFLVSNLTKEIIFNDKGILFDEFLSISMLGGRKLILIKESDVSVSEALKNLFADGELLKKSDNFILIQAGDLDKNSSLRKLCESSPNFAAIACYEDDDRLVKRLILDQLSKNNLKANQKIIDYLFEKLGKNRYIIISEIEKLNIYLSEKKDNILTTEIIDLVIGLEGESSANQFIFDFINKQNNASVLQAEKLIRDGFEVIGLTRFLLNYLQKLYSAKNEIDLRGLDINDVIKSQKLFFKVENEFRKHLRSVKTSELKNLLIKLEELEVNLKKSYLPQKSLFIRFLQER